MSESDVLKIIKTARDEKWTYLDLSKRDLSELPAEIGQLTQLIILNLSYNRLTKLPPEIGQITQLQELYLFQNRLTELPAEIGQLAQLQRIILNQNQLIKLPGEIMQLQALKEIYTSENPLKYPPTKIVSLGIEAIQNYFRSIEEGEEYIYEAMLILIGEPGSGKTSLARKIINPEYPLHPTEPMTKGCDIERWYILYKENIKFTVNIWDFGGQEIMHATHRYFLTKRSLYIVVADNRKEDTDFYYWLHMVKLLSASSPVLIVLNEKYMYKKYVPADILQSFKNIQAVFNVNLADNSGLSDLLRAIQHYLTNLPHVGKEPIPKKWARIRLNLEELNKNYIMLEEYFQICKKNGIDKEEKALFISEFLHDLGIILHFQKDRLLINTIILNPHWATEAVYLILLDPTIIENNGEFDNDDLARLWKQSEYRYSHAVLLRLMINFELCYEIGNSQKYIIPELLYEKSPVEEYPEEFKSLKHFNFLHFEYQYKFIPKGIISRLIVKMNKYIYKQLYWKNGVIFHYDNTYAEVIEQFHNKKIKIRIFGNEKQVFLSILRSKINEIHDSYEKLEFNEMVPCLCEGCRRKDAPFFFIYSLLQKYYENNIKTIRCNESLQDVSVRELLTGFEIRKEKEYKEWDVFISYSSKDFNLIQELIKDFKENKITYWLDDEQIKLGDHIIPKIENGLSNSRFILVCFSRNQLKSGWTRYEYDSVLHDAISNQENKKHVIPLILDDQDPDELPRFIRGIRYVDFSNKKDYKRLLGFLSLADKNFEVKQEEVTEKYTDFEIHISRDGMISAYSSEGERRSEINIEISNNIKLTLMLIEQNQTNTDLLKRFGMQLYDLLFSPSIHIHFNQTEAVAKTRNQKIRIRLNIESNELAMLPWEFTFRNVGGYFFSVNPDTVISRYINLPLPVNRVKQRKGKLNMLVIISNPPDQISLDPYEWENIFTTALQEQIQNGRLNIRTIKTATISNISDALLAQKPDIVQFVGHGIYQNQKGYLALIDENTGGTIKIDNNSFAGIFLGVKDTLGLVCLATCESAKSDSPQGFLSIAPKIVKKGVPAVVAMRYGILVKSAKIFFKEFYKVISARKPVDWAVQWARNQVALNFGLDNREFATPVLFMREKDGDIF